jgi:hypothetical protein
VCVAFGWPWSIHAGGERQTDLAFSDILAADAPAAAPVPLPEHDPHLTVSSLRWCWVDVTVHAMLCRLSPASAYYDDTGVSQRRHAVPARRIAASSAVWFDAVMGYLFV